MKTRSASTAVGGGATATLNLRGDSPSSLPSFAESPGGPSRGPQRNCVTPARTAGTTEAGAVNATPGLGLVVIVVIDAVGDDGGAGIALGYGYGPEAAGSGGGPFARQAGFGGDAVAGGTAELRPIRSGGCRGGQEGGGG